MKRGHLRTQLAKVEQQKDQLLNLRLNEEIDADTYDHKAEQLRDCESLLVQQIDKLGKNQDDFADITIKAFELSQKLTSKWLDADYAAKRRLLEILGSNFVLDGVSLVPTIRKPFSVFAEGPVLATSTP